MPHYGTLAEHRFSADVDDIRGSALYGVDNEKLGAIDDVIFDHHSGSIRYVVVDTGGWLRSRKFVVPAARIHACDKDKDAFQIDLVKAHVERFPVYDENSLASEKDWAAYEARYQQTWHEGVVQHRLGSDRNITPTPGEMPRTAPPGRGSLGEDVPEDLAASRSLDPGLASHYPAHSGFGSLGEEIEEIDSETLRETGQTPVDYTPQRLPEKFPDPQPSSGKIQMHTAAAEGEQRFAAEREINRGPRFDRFEDLLRRNRVDITAKCPSCQTAKDKAA
jgi:sporulation protein YlmC with PRC-barrel domain